MSSFLFCSLNLYKIANYFILKQVKKKNVANSLRILVLFTQKIVTKYMDLGSEIRDPEAKKAPVPGSESATLPVT